MRVIIIMLLGVAFVLNAYILTRIYPANSTDLDVWFTMDTKRHLVYEFMFAAFFWLTYSLSDRLLKAVSCCFAILSTGSVIDKCFGITSYLKSDILLIIISIAVSVYGFLREREQRG